MEQIRNPCRTFVSKPLGNGHLKHRDGRIISRWFLGKDVIRLEGEWN
jgi:hypothetical protein